MSMNVLLLGGTGFIGSHVCDALLQRQHHVRIFSRQAERYRQPLAGVDYIFADFTDRFALSEALTDMDCVIHLISSTVPGTSNLDPVSDIMSNLAPTVSLLELMRQSGPKKLIFLSSGGTVYGTPDTVPVKEDAPLRPVCSYGVVKVAIEKYLAMYHHLYDLQTVILRASNPYGPRQGRLRVQGLIATFLSRLQQGKPLEVWGDGEVVRDYFHVHDLAELCVRAVESDRSGVFNAGSGEGTSINQIIHLIRQVTGADPEVNYTAGRSFDVDRVFLDIRAAREAYRWQPLIPLHEGIRMHWEWLQQEGET